MSVRCCGSTTAARSATATCGGSAPGSCSSRASSSRISARGSARSRSSPRSRRRVSASGCDGRRAPLKAALLDQRTLAGLGNIYVDEALWYAKLHPLRPAGSLDARRAAPPPPRDPEGARARDRPPGLDALRLPASGRLLGDDAEGVPRLRPHRRAVRPLRHAAREDARRRPRARGSARAVRRSDGSGARCRGCGRGFCAKTARGPDVPGLSLPLGVGAPSLFRLYPCRCPCQGCRRVPSSCPASSQPARPWPSRPWPSPPSALASQP